MRREKKGYTAKGTTGVLILIENMKKPNTGQNFPEAGSLKFQSVEERSGWNESFQRWVRTQLVWPMYFGSIYYCTCTLVDHGRKAAKFEDAVGSCTRRLQGVFEKFDAAKEISINHSDGKFSFQPRIHLRHHFH